jgi:hypothetical protein
MRTQKKSYAGREGWWSPGGYCHTEKKHIKGYNEQQIAYFTEALTLIDRHLKNFNHGIIKG